MKRVSRVALIAAIGLTAAVRAQPTATPLAPKTTPDLNSACDDLPSGKVQQLGAKKEYSHAIDLRTENPPVLPKQIQNQASAGWCFTHAAQCMLASYAIKENRIPSDNPLFLPSRVDLNMGSVENHSLNLSSEGGNIDDVLYGVSNRDYKYTTEAKTPYSDSFFLGEQSPSAQFAKFYSQKGAQATLPNNQTNADFAISLSADTSHILQQASTGQDKEAFAVPQKEIAFFEKPQAKNVPATIELPPFQTHVLKPQGPLNESEALDILSSIRTQLTNKTPLGVSVCMNELRPNGRKTYETGIILTSVNCGYHSLVVVGMYKDPKTQLCQVILRNSWGAEWNGDGHMTVSVADFMRSFNRKLDTGTIAGNVTWISKNRNGDTGPRNFVDSGKDTSFAGTISLLPKPGTKIDFYTRYKSGHLVIPSQKTDLILKDGKRWEGKVQLETGASVEYKEGQIVHYVGRWDTSSKDSYDGSVSSDTKGELTMIDGRFVDASQGTDIMLKDGQNWEGVRRQNNALWTYAQGRITHYKGEWDPDKKSTFDGEIATQDNGNGSVSRMPVNGHFIDPSVPSDVIYKDKIIWSGDTVNSQGAHLTYENGVQTQHDGFLKDGYTYKGSFLNGKPQDGTLTNTKFKLVIQYKGGKPWEGVTVFKLASGGQAQVTFKEGKATFWSGDWSGTPYTGPIEEPTPGNYKKK